MAAVGATMRLAVALGLAGVAALQGQCAEPLDSTGACTDKSDESSLLQLRGTTPTCTGPECPGWTPTDPVKACGKPKALSDIGGKSIYFILVDRFARSDGNNSACLPRTEWGDDSNAWCGGNLRGIAEHLDYIEGMGFEGVWITPVVGQYDRNDTILGEGCEPWPESMSKCTSHGYWAYQWYQIDRHFGTKDDFKYLVAELHKRNMFLMYDFVTNHVGPIHSLADLSRVYPFNKVEHYSKLKFQELAGGDFDKYTAKYVNWPPPVQAMWTGAQCGEEFRNPPNSYPNGCNCWACPYDPGFGPCNQSFSFWKEGPCKPDMISPFCMAGDYACKGYSDETTHFGWFYDLGDLNQTNPEVKAMLLQWGRHMVDTFDLDAVRLDTASYMPLAFLQALQEAVCVPIIGESTVTNMTFLAQLQADPPPTGKRGLAGALNFPLTYAAAPAFCGTFENRYWPFAHKNMSFLGARMTEQLAGPYVNLDLLGNQVDNHDVARITKSCNGDMTLIRNALVWNMLAKGMPTIYYGTEVYETEQRNSFWQYGWNTTTPGYLFLKALNTLRKTEDLGKSPLEVRSATDSTLVFSRGRKVLVFVNNLGSASGSVKYCKVSSWTKCQWVDVLTGATLSRDAQGCFLAPSAEPIVAYRAALKWLPK